MGIARQVATERVISTVDPEARHAHKTRARRQDGYKAHVVVEPDTGIVTDTALTLASGPDNTDAAAGIALLAEEPDPVEVLGDSAYGSGEMLDAAQTAGHTPCPTAAEVDRQRLDRHAHPSATRPPTPRATRHADHDLALAPTAAHPPLDFRCRSTWTTRRPRRPPRPGPPPGHGERASATPHW